MRLTILGSGTCVPSLKRKPCAVLLQTNSTNILLDIGPGIIGQILRAGLTINDMDMIFLSHFHLDHCADLAPFIFATKYPGFDRQRKLTLYGGQGVRSFYDRLNEAHNGHLELPASIFEVVELSDTGTDYILPGVELAWVKTVHKPESRAFRFQASQGGGVVYTGDTDWCDALVPFCRNIDLVICESAMPDALKVAGHMTPGLAGRLAARANAGRLMLTHFYPECDQVDIMAECRRQFSRQVMLAEDLMSVELDEMV